MSLWTPDPDQPNNVPLYRGRWKLIGGLLDGIEFRAVTPKLPLYLFVRSKGDGDDGSFGIEVTAVDWLAKPNEFPGYHRYAMRHGQHYGDATFVYSPEHHADPVDP